MVAFSSITQRSQHQWQQVGQRITAHKGRSLANVKMSISEKNLLPGLLYLGGYCHSVRGHHLPPIPADVEYHSVFDLLGLSNRS